MSAQPEVMPYRHEIAVGSEWLINILTQSLAAHRMQLEMELSVARTTGDVSLVRDTTSALVSVMAAQKQLTEEAQLHNGG